MKLRGQMAVGGGFDGFDKNVAEKMPKIKREEELSLPIIEEETPPTPPLQTTPQEIKPPEKQVERKAIFTPPPQDEDKEENLEVLRLIEDLHGQLLVSNRTKRALEIDLASSQKMIHHMAKENQVLSIQIEGLKKELQSLQEAQSEVAYLEEENEDALERITLLQGEIRTLKEGLARAHQEKDQAMGQIQTLEDRIEQTDILRIKGRLKEKEVSHFFEENKELRLRLEEVLAQNMDLEKRYEVLKKSFNEVKDSLTLLRDACKANYYNLSPDSPESG